MVSIEGTSKGSWNRFDGNDGVLNNERALQTLQAGFVCKDEYGQMLRRDSLCKWCRVVWCWDGYGRGASSRSSVGGVCLVCSAAPQSSDDDDKRAFSSQRAIP